MRGEYDVVVSEAITDELSHPDFPHSQDALGMVVDIPRIEIVDEVRDIVKVYISRSIMPQNPVGDALHLALASYHKCDYLLTWNCKHLANPNKFQRIRIVNTSLVHVGVNN